jgi:hypothetical protein
MGQLLAAPGADANAGGHELEVIAMEENSAFRHASLFDVQCLFDVDLESIRLVVHESVQHLHTCALPLSYSARGLLFSLLLGHVELKVVMAEEAPDLSGGSGVRRRRRACYRGKEGGNRCDDAAHSGPSGYV